MPSIKDSFQRPLHLGDKLMVTTGEPSVYTLVDMVPATDPRLPKEAVMVTLQATVRMVLKEGMPMKGFVRVLSVAEQGLTEGSDQPPNPSSPEKSTTRILQ